jgi:hypothetical protein
MDIAAERKNFAERLQSALRRARQSPSSPTALARNFNSRYAGRAVTVHAARKWLLAEAIPTQDKLRALAQWLEVPADWLRFGTHSVQRDQAGGQGAESEVQALLARMSQEEVTLVEEMHALENDERHLVREMIHLFFKKQQQARDAVDAG